MTYVGGVLLLLYLLLESLGMSEVSLPFLLLCIAAFARGAWREGRRIGYEEAISNEWESKKQ